MLLASDVREVVLLTSYMADAFAEVKAGARQRGMTMNVAHEAEPLDTAGALKNAEELIGDDTFLAFNGDILSDLNIKAVIDRHASYATEATIVLTPVDDPSSFGVVPTEDDGRVIGFIEKPPPGEAPTNMINAGIYVLEPSVLRRVPAGERYNAERQLFPELVAAGAMCAFPTDAYWIDIGTPEKYLQANLDALSGRFKTDAVRSPGEGIVVAGEDVDLASSARMTNACIGARSTIEAGCIVDRSVLLPRVVVGRDAKVVGSVLGEGARVAAGARLSGAAVADGQVVP
jgi:mannose-1-phosphate guanylyltransferase